jgi:hypothetical protein
MLILGKIFGRQDRSKLNAVGLIKRRRKARQFLELGDPAA